MEEPPDVVQVAIASKLTDPKHRDEFLRLSRRCEAWLRGQPGFLRYELYETGDGWLDTMLWRDQMAAEAGNAAFAQTDIAAGFSQIVQPGYRAYLGKLTRLQASEAP